MKKPRKRQKAKRKPDTMTGAMMFIAMEEKKRYYMGLPAEVKRLTEELDQAKEWAALAKAELDNQDAIVQQRDLAESSAASWEATCEGVKVDLNYVESAFKTLEQKHLNRLEELQGVMASAASWEATAKESDSQVQFWIKSDATLRTAIEILKSSNEQKMEGVRLQFANVAKERDSWEDVARSEQKLRGDEVSRWSEICDSVRGEGLKHFKLSSERKYMLDALCRNLEIANKRFAMIADRLDYTLLTEKWAALDYAQGRVLALRVERNAAQALASSREAELISVRGKIAEAERRRDVAEYFISTMHPELFFKSGDTFYCDAEMQEEWNQAIKDQWSRPNLKRNRPWYSRLWHWWTDPPSAKDS